MTKVLIVGYGSVGNRHLENFLQFKDIQLIVYKKRLERYFQLKFRVVLIYQTIIDGKIIGDHMLQEKN